MEDDLICPKRKIIQKRVKKRERYARMARIRYRKERNVPLAKFDYLPSPIKVHCSKPLYHFYMDLMVVEDEGELKTFSGIINKIKLCNSISIIGDEDENKVLCLKYHDTQNTVPSNWVEVVQNWENRSDPYWRNWASQIRKFSLDYENFMMNYARMLEEQVFDKKYTQKYQNFLAKRNELMSSTSSYEVKFRLEGNQIKLNELNITEKLIQRTEYDLEEFADMIFKGGSPKTTSYHHESQMNVLNLVIEHFHDIFDKDVEMTFPETYLVKKDKTLLKVPFTVRIVGHFVKKAPEISLFMTYGETTTEVKNQSSIPYYSQIDSEFVVKQEAELKEFLKKFYNEDDLSSFLKSEEICRVKPLDNQSTDSSEIREKIEVKQEIDWKSPDSQSQGKEIKPIQLRMPYFPSSTLAQSLWNFTNSLNQFTSSLRINESRLGLYNPYYY